MRYAQHRSSKRVSLLPRAIPKKSAVLILVGIAIAVTIILIARPNAASKEGETDLAATIEPAVAVEPEVQAVPDQDVVTFEETDLFVPESRVVNGFARRGEDASVFTHVLVANLSAIDMTTHYYEAWLVKPGVTDFFSTGEMFAREDGKFGLVWEKSLDAAPNDIFDFNQVIITREIRDGNPAPSVTHVAKGEF